MNYSSDGLYTHHDRLVIPRLAQYVCILLLLKCHIRLAITIVNAYWQLCENVSEGKVCITLDCKALSSNCVVCNCSKPI